jgi:hypothetical protein
MICTFVLDIFANFVGNLRVQSFLVSHFFLDFQPGELIWCELTTVEE